MSDLSALFEDYAAFYRDRYVPFLQEEGFIDNPDDSEFGKGVDGFVTVDVAKLGGGSAWPASLGRLLSEVGSCSVNFPTAEGPVPLYVMSPSDMSGWREPGLKSVASYLKMAGSSAPSASDAWPFLTDASGEVAAFVSTVDDGIYVVNDEGKLRGPVDSLETFFALVFENAREHRMPFEGMASIAPA